MESVQFKKHSKISIFGAPGSGKSTLAMLLSEKLGYEWLRLNDIDVYLSEKLGRAPEENEWQAELEARLKKSNWICDGYYTRSILLRIKYSDLIVFLDLALWQCLYSALIRGWNNLRGRSSTTYATYGRSLRARCVYLFSPRVYSRIFRFYFIRKNVFLKLIGSSDSRERVLRIRSRGRLNDMLQFEFEMDRTDVLSTTQADGPMRLKK